MDFGINKERIFIWKKYSPEEKDNSSGVPQCGANMVMDIHNSSTSAFHFHSAIGISSSKLLMYACVSSAESNTVTCYSRSLKATSNSSYSDWTQTGTLANKDNIYSVLFSPDEVYLVGVVPFGFNRWDIRNSRMLYMELPQGSRNIPKYASYT